MRIIEYYLLPESGYTGTYSRNESHYLVKDGTIADLIHDSNMLWGADYDKAIPPLNELNEILREGYFLRLAEWQPIEIYAQEYEEIVRMLLDIPMAKPYRI